MDNDCYLWKSSYEKPGSNLLMVMPIGGGSGTFLFQDLQLWGTGPVNMKLG
jgi:hypothetical protein